MKVNSRGYVDTGFIRYLTKEEFKKIDKDIEQNIYSPSMYWCLKVLTRTGLRVSDVVNLNIGELKNDFKMIDKIMQKTKKQIRIPLSRELSEGLKKYWYRGCGA